jgi:hypothetical protein
VLVLLGRAAAAAVYGCQSCLHVLDVETVFKKVLVKRRIVLLEVALAPAVASGAPLGSCCCSCGFAVELIQVLHARSKGSAAEMLTQGLIDKN